MSAESKTVWTHAITAINPIVFGARIIPDNNTSHGQIPTSAGGHRSEPAAHGRTTRSPGEIQQRVPTNGERTGNDGGRARIMNVPDGLAIT